MFLTREFTAIQAFPIKRRPREIKAARCRFEILSQREGRPALVPTRESTTRFLAFFSDFSSVS